MSLKSSLKSAIKHNPIYASYIRPLRVKLNTLIESRLTDEQYFVRRHKKIFGYTPDFRNPQTFNEKIIHRILFDRSPVYTALADKLKARIYIAATLYPLYENAIRGGAECNASLDSSLDSSAQPTIQALAKLNLLEPSSPLFAPIDTLESTLLATNICPYLPKLYGIYKSFDEIDFAHLPQAFAIKTNHDCGGVVLVPNKQEFLRDQARFEAARSKIQQHLATNFYTLFREWHYKDIEPRVFIEELLGADSRESSTKTFENDDFHNKIEFKQTPLADVDTSSVSIDVLVYRFFCFDKARYIQASDLDVYGTRYFYDRKWNFQPFSYDNEVLADEMPYPPALPQGVEIADRICSSLSFVRVDLYLIHQAVVVGELTLTPEGGTLAFTPNEWDRKLGDLWR